MSDKPTIKSAQAFIREALEGFVRDPADTAAQQGYLEALYVVGREALGMGFDEKAPPTRPSLRVVK